MPPLMRMPKHIEPSRPHTLREVREIERQPEPEPSKEADDSREDQMSFDLCGDEEQPVRCRDQPGEHHLAPQEVVAGQHVDTLATGARSKEQSKLRAGMSPYRT